MTFQEIKLGTILEYLFLVVVIKRFSGITKNTLEPVTTKLKDVQKQLRALLPPDAVLVGHSLDLDLRALQASIFSLNPRTLPPSLLAVAFSIHSLLSSSDDTSICY